MPTAKKTTAATETPKTPKAKAASKPKAVGDYAKTHLPFKDKDEIVLMAGLSDGLSIFEIATTLSRDPCNLLRMLDTLELFEFDCWSEEESELYSLALSGASIADVLQWCLGLDGRKLRADVLSESGTGEDLLPALTARREHQIVGMGLDVVADLRWIAEQDQQAVSTAVTALVDAIEPPTAKLVRQVMSGQVSVRAVNAFQSHLFRPAVRPITDYDMTLFDNVNSGKKASKSKSGTTTRYASKTAGKTTFKRGRRGGRYGSRTRSPSMPSGAPVRDTRSAADKAWENKTHW